MIFDSHAHYDDDAFNEDRETLIDSLKEYGVGHVLNVAASLESTKTTIALADRYEQFYAAVGVHPNETAPLNEDNFAWLQARCRDRKVVAVGEIGLDYYWDEPEREIQKYWFRRQLQMAREEKLPVIIHSRDAAKDTYDIMKELHAEEIGGVVHCFSYSLEMAKEFEKMGFSFGIGGVVTFKNAKKLKEVVEYLPLEKILLETDCPYLTPVPYRGKRNSSIYLPYVVEEIAEIKGVSTQEVIDTTEQNVYKLFGIK